MKDQINIYKLKDRYSLKLDSFIKDLDTNTKKAIDDGRNINK
jgi:hypothetical protein